MILYENFQQSCSWNIKYFWEEFDIKSFRQKPWKCHIIHSNSISNIRKTQIDTHFWWNGTRIYLYKDIYQALISESNIFLILAFSETIKSFKLISIFYFLYYYGSIVSLGICIRIYKKNISLFFKVYVLLYVLIAFISEMYNSIYEWNLVTECFCIYANVLSLLPKLSRRNDFFTHLQYN